jgi:hypothetical protein
MFWWHIDYWDERDIDKANAVVSTTWSIQTPEYIRWT